MTLKLLFWALMVIVNIKTGFYELIITRLHKRRHLTFIKHFSRSLSSCLTGPHTQSFFDTSFHISKVPYKSHLKWCRIIRQRTWKEHGKVPHCLSDQENRMNVSNIIAVTDNRGIRPIKSAGILSEILLTDWILSSEFQNATKWIPKIPKSSPIWFLLTKIRHVSASRWSY